MSEKERTGIDPRKTSLAEKRTKGGKEGRKGKREMWVWVEKEILLMSLLCSLSSFFVDSSKSRDAYLIVCCRLRFGELQCWEIEGKRKMLPVAIPIHKYGNTAAAPYV